MPGEWEGLLIALAVAIVSSLSGLAARGEGKRGGRRLGSDWDKVMTFL